MGFQQEAWALLLSSPRGELFQIIQTGDASLGVGARTVTLGDAVVLEARLGQLSLKSSRVRLFTLVPLS
jgi:hypothetical protein